MTEFFWRSYTRALSQPQPKWIERLEEYNPGPVKIPNIWQVLFIPVLIMFVAWLLTRGD